MSDKLTPDKLKLLAAMLEGRNIPQAAAHVGMIERTARRWAAAPEFQIELQRRSSEILAASGRAIAGLMQSATMTAANIMRDPAMPPSVRLAAARLILDRRDALVTELDILPRLAQLEKLLDEQSQ